MRSDRVVSLPGTALGAASSPAPARAVAVGLGLSLAACMVAAAPAEACSIVPNGGVTAPSTLLNRAFAEQLSAEAAMIDVVELVDVEEIYDRGLWTAWADWYRQTRYPGAIAPDAYSTDVLLKHAEAPVGLRYIFAVKERIKGASSERFALLAPKHRTPTTAQLSPYLVGSGKVDVFDPYGVAELAPWSVYQSEAYCPALALHALRGQQYLVLRNGEGHLVGSGPTRPAPGQSFVSLRGELAFDWLAAVRSAAGAPPR